MATATRATTVRIDDGLKDEAVSILQSMGISFNSYVSMATHQLVNQRRIPFECVAASAPRPNEQTRRALVAAEAKELGLIPDDAAAFDSVDDLMAYLDGE